MFNFKKKLTNQERLDLIKFKRLVRKNTFIALKRFYAKVIDYSIIGFPTCFLGGRKLIPLFALLVIIIETVLIAELRFTPGKWLLNIKVVNKEDGKKLTLENSFKRSVMLFISGIGVLFLSILTIPLSYIAYTRKDVTIWDNVANSKIECREIETYKKVILVVIGLFYIMLINFIVLLITSYKP